MSALRRCALTRKGSSVRSVTAGSMQDALACLTLSIQFSKILMSHGAVTPALLRPCPFTTALTLPLISTTVCTLSPHLDPPSLLLPRSITITPTIYYLNCCSLLPKLDSLRAQAISSNPSIIALVETWLDSSITTHEISIPAYSCICRDRHRHGGGIILYLRSDICILSSSSHPSMELLFVNLQLKQGTLVVGLYYRPPSDINFLPLLDLALQDLHPSHPVVLLGDFNVNLLPDHKNSPLARDHL